ncbi:hypothetical protein LEMLEM_LOCUS16571 [Lemmus lemmus]
MGERNESAARMGISKVTTGFISIGGTEIILIVLGKI